MAIFSLHQIKNYSQIIVLLLRAAVTVMCKNSRTQKNKMMKKTHWKKEATISYRMMKRERTHKSPTKPLRLIKTILLSKRMKMYANVCACNFCTWKYGCLCVRSRSQHKLDEVYNNDDDVQTLHSISVNQRKLSHKYDRNDVFCCLFIVLAVESRSLVKWSKCIFYKRTQIRAQPHTIHFWFTISIPSKYTNFAPKQNNTELVNKQAHAYQKIIHTYKCHTLTYNFILIEFKSRRKKTIE